MAAQEAVREASRISKQQWNVETHPKWEQALSVPKTRLDVLLIDLGDIRGFDSIRSLKLRQPRLRILVLGAPPGHDALQSIAGGACGYLLKPITPVLIIDAVEVAMKGLFVLCPRSQSLLASALRRIAKTDPLWSNLTPREIEILPLLRLGATDKEIGSRLGIATATVNAHLKNIYRKLGVSSRRAAAIWNRDASGPGVHPWVTHS